MHRIVAIVFLLATACVSLNPVGSKIEGAIGSFTPSECFSGDREYFLGVDLQSDARNMRVVIEPLGDVVVRVDDPHKRRLIDRSKCAELHAEIEPTGWKVNEVRDLRGTLQMSKCQADDGEVFDGTIRFAHCH